MLTKLAVKRFKQLQDVEIELGSPVVFVGPNNSGKTSALQALTLWGLGLRKWNEKRSGGKSVPKKRPGITINRKDAISIPVPYANHLWYDLHVRTGGNKEESSPNIRIEIIVEGVTNSKTWSCGLEFDYANEESFYCRPLRTGNGSGDEQPKLPDEASLYTIGFLQPMSGLATTEARIDIGKVNVLIGEGQTAQVLRNLCHRVYEPESTRGDWEEIVDLIEANFGERLLPPQYDVSRGEINLHLRNRRGVEIDISGTGRGLQQTLLLLSYLAANPNTVLLLDEPDAHLEFIRQRHLYDLITEAARKRNSQVVIASHSEVILREAADRDMVVAFLGRPHRIDDRSRETRLISALKEIGFDQYFLAEQKGWVLYLEGSTDLSILKSFAKKLAHPAFDHLEQSFTHYVGNQPNEAQKHYNALAEAKQDLVGLAVYDRIVNPINNGRLEEYSWARREIENYLCHKTVLLKWAEENGKKQGDLGELSGSNWATAMEQCISQLETSLSLLNKESPWGNDLKVTDDFLDPLFKNFFETLQLPNLMRKRDYHELAMFVETDDIPDEVREVLDKIAATASAARPVT